MSLLQNSNAISSGGYNIANSLRFQSASSQYLSRTPSVAGNRKTWTWSGWVKRGALGVSQDLFEAATSAALTTILWIDSNNCLNFQGGFNLTTTQVFRDPSNWYHILLAVDTTQATASNRAKIYVNGFQITAFSTTGYENQNVDTFVNSTISHAIGRRPFDTTLPFDGYMAEVNFIDGVSLTPSSFGEFDSLTGQWVAKKYTGTYGTNGFYLPFSNGTSTTTLGYDSSGNSNNWTLNNFTRSAGVSDCWMYDVPSGNGSSVGGTQPNSNYAVLNPLNMMVSNYMTTSRANLAAVRASNAGDGAISSTMNVNSGKWYWEVIVSGSNTDVGIVKDSDSYAVQNTSFYIGSSSTSYGYYKTGQKINAATLTAYGSAYTANAVIGVALDLDTGTIIFYKDGISQGVAFTGIIGNFSPALSDYPSTTNHFNFGQRSFAYTPPTGFKALCTANLPASTIVKGNQFMDATTYTGTATANQTQTITNAAGFSPDLVWVKSRSLGGSNNMLSDSVRGFGTNCMNSLFTDSTSAELSDLTNASLPTGYGAIFSLNSNGFTLKAGSTNGNQVNASGQTYVAWQWDAGSSTVTNTSGTISSQVRANPTAGVSVVTYTGNGLANQTVGHGLGVTPKFVIYKARSTTSVWIVTSPLLGVDNYLELNTTSATKSAAGFLPANTSSVLSVSGAFVGAPNTANTQVAYCFSEIAGFSKFSSFVGNGNADGSFVYVGFKPKFVMIKRSNSTGNWEMFDTSRRPANMNISVLSANSSAAEVNVSTYGIDITSNGFKLRTADATINGSGGTYIFACFAENPFAQSNAA